MIGPRTESVTVLSAVKQSAVLHPSDNRNGADGDNVLCSPRNGHRPGASSDQTSETVADARNPTEAALC